jgi:hypothetical protein
LALYFFNPDAFKIDGRTREIKYQRRIETLVRHLENPELRPTAAITFFLFYYDIDKGIPRLFSDSDFPADVVPFVKLVDVEAN